MERLISPLTSIDEVDTQLDVSLCEIEEYTGGLSASLMFNIPQGSMGKRIRVDVADDLGAVDLAFNAASLRLPMEALRRQGEARYAVDIDGELLEVAISGFDTVTVPYRKFDHFEIVVLTDEADTLIVNNLRAVTDELPQDILRGFLEMELPRYSLGQISVKKRDRKVRLPDITHVSEGVVLALGSHSYRVKGLVGDLATLDECVQEDYEGEILLDTPIRIGYYDQNIDLPSVVVWFTSPSPDLRAVRRESYKVFGQDAYVKERTQFEEWTVRLEVVGNSPEATQAVATCVRRFLERNRIWVNGKRFTFEWTDSAVDTEPSSYLDIKPSVAYNIKINLQEELPWQTVQKGSGRLRSVVPTLRI